MDSGLKGKWRLTVRDQFSAAHALRGYCGKCENLHGHNFRVEITVEGTRLDEAGMLIDFGILKRGLREILARLDHHVLNQIEPFDALNPSSENLARHIYAEFRLFLANELSAKEARLTEVSVSEKEAQTATWLPEA